jgi:hypothetical protein
MLAVEVAAFGGWPTHHRGMALLKRSRSLDALRIERTRQITSSYRANVSISPS